MNSRTLLACHLLQFSFFLAFLPFQSFSLETDTISSNVLLRDPDNIVSRGQIFRFGFFSPTNTTHRYLGVFYNVSENTVIWVANRDRPLTDTSGTVSISHDGNLVLTNGANETIWSTNATSPFPMTTTAQIQNTGNLVLRHVGPPETTLWESFSHPSNVYVPSMRISDNTNTGEKVVLSAWRNVSDPEVGSFTSGVVAGNIPEILTWNNGRPHWRSGPWNGRILIGIQDMYGEYIPRFAEIDNDDAGTVYFTIPQAIFLTKVELNSSGVLAQVVWNNQSRNWDTAWFAPETQCDVYGMCGPFGSCNALESPVCSCLSGFEPLDGEEWRRWNWSGGCGRRNQLQCGQNNSNTNTDDGGNGDRFLRLQFMKVPDFAERFPSGQEAECRRRCLSNCSCIAYAHDPTIGCMFWSQSLIDAQRFADVGVDLYIRLSASEFDSHNDSKLVIIIPAIVGGVVSISVIVIIAWCLIVKRKKANNKKIFEAGQTSYSTAIVLKDELENVNIEELPLFSFDTLANATDQFHENNLLGRGGFGPVYKGNLGNGKEIAVKRLSVASGQGMEEFMNEVLVISKLQHRNLVRLMGCCVDKEEKMLIYEYMPNKSLDVCLFDSTHPSQNILDWKKRFSIIEGIGRGLLYLHRDSRFKIIHRDLKPSNVLLDEEWNPKISDFGMARIFGGNQDHENTARVVGTFGYMATEYAMEGQFSEKSDVYSFGVLVLEIVNGKKNTRYYNHEWSLGLLGCAWKLWSEDKVLAFADESVAIGSDYEAEMVRRCIHIGLLCVQEVPKDRPTIQTVLSMLSREIVDLPPPEQPLFAEKWNGMHVGSTQPTGQVGYSVNGLTLTVLDGR